MRGGRPWLERFLAAVQATTAGEHIASKQDAQHESHAQLSSELCHCFFLQKPPFKVLLFYYPPKLGADERCALPNL